MLEVLLRDKIPDSVQVDFSRIRRAVKMSSRNNNGQHANSTRGVRLRRATNQSRVVSNLEYTEKEHATMKKHMVLTLVAVFGLSVGYGAGSDLPDCAGDKASWLHR